MWAESNPVKMKFPFVSDLADDSIPVSVTCRILKIARRPYYRWLASPVTDPNVADAYRLNRLIDAHRN